MRLCFFILMGWSFGYLSAQIKINIPPNEMGLKVWGEGENTYIKTNYFGEAIGFWGYVSKNEVVRFYKITAQSEAKELVFDVLEPYITHKEEMKKQFFYFGHYALLIVQTDAILFDLEAETHQVIIDNDPLFLSDTWYNIYYAPNDHMLTLIATNGSMKIFTYDLAEGELTNEEVQLEGVKLKRPEIIDKNRVVCRYEVDKTTGWLIMDTDTKEAEQITIPDEFPKFRSCEFFRIPGDDGIYMKIVAELTNSYYSKVKTYIYQLGLTDHLLNKKMEIELFVVGTGFMRLGDWALLGGNLDVETKALLCTNGEFSTVMSGPVNLNHCFYHAGEFYCYKDLSKSNTSKPKLYKLDRQEYAWKEEKTLTEKANILTYLFYVNDQPQSIFVEQLKGEQSLSFTPRIF